MNQTLIGFLSVLLGSSLAAAAVVQDYQYPKISSNLATISTALISSPGAKFETIEVGVIPSRNKNEFLSGRGKFSVDVFKPKSSKAKGLVYIVGGLGAGEASGTSRAYAILMQNHGYIAVTLASPFSWQHSLRLSDDGLVGYLPNDSKELARAVASIESQITGGQQLERVLIGYSLGGLAVPHVTKAFDETGLTVSKAVMINPPVKLAESINKLDSLYKIKDGWSQEKIQAIESYVISIGSSVLGTDVQLDEEFAKKYPIPDYALTYMIAKTFRDSLFEIVFTSQSVKDLGILKKPASNLKRESRYAEAKSYTFMNYIQQFLYPQLQAKGESRSIEEVMYDISIQGLRQPLVSDKRFFLMHNMDDFLVLDEETKEFLLGLPEDMTILYPRGGHMGNVNFPQNQKDLLALIESKTRN